MVWFWNYVDNIYHNSSKAVIVFQILAFILTVGLSWLAYTIVDEQFEEKDYEDMLSRLLAS